MTRSSLWAAAVCCLVLVDIARCLAQVEATDAWNRRVELEQPAQRVVALAPHIVENLYSLGVGERIVAAVAYSDFPTEAKRLPRLGGVAGISLERLIEAEPDLVVAWASGTPDSVLAALEEFDISYFVDEIRSLEGLALSLENLGTLTGAREEASKQAARVRSAGSGIRVTGTQPPSVLIQIWDQPLQSIGREHLLTEVVRRCGGRSITDAASGLAPQVSLEAVVEQDPDLIIVESEAQAKHWARFPELTAYQQPFGIRVINPDLLYRPTLRLLDGMRELCGAIDEVRR